MSGRNKSSPIMSASGLGQPSSSSEPPYRITPQQLHAMHSFTAYVLNSLPYAGNLQTFTAAATPSVARSTRSRTFPARLRWANASVARFREAESFLARLGGTVSFAARLGVAAILAPAVGMVKASLVRPLDASALTARLREAESSTARLHGAESIMARLREAEFSRLGI